MSQHVSEGALDTRIDPEGRLWILWRGDASLPVSEKDTGERLVRPLAEMKDPVTYWRPQFPPKVVIRTHTSELFTFSDADIPTAFLKNHF